MSPRNSQRVGRRRRVFVDESRNEGQAAARPRIFRGDTDAPAGRYNSQALQSLNAPIAKYIPLRKYALVLWFLIGFLPIMGLLSLHEWRFPIAQRIGGEATRCFHLSSDGNLVAWLSSVAFAFAVVVMLGIYSVRRYRRDDYRGHFTIWRWGILAAMLASVDSTVGLHNTWQACCQTVTQTTLAGNGSVWWIGLWGLFFGGIMMRLMFEMAYSRLAVAATVAAATCYAWSGLVELSVLPFLSAGWLETSKVAALMTGHHLVLFALVSYARQIVLEAMGTAQPPRKKRKPEQQPAPDPAAREAVTDEPPRVAVRMEETAAATEEMADSVTRQAAEDANFNVVASSRDEDERDGGARGLSKAERRRQRKEKRRKAA